MPVKPILRETIFATGFIFYSIYFFFLAIEFISATVICSHGDFNFSVKPLFTKQKRGVQS